MGAGFSGLVILHQSFKYTLMLTYTQVLTCLTKSHRCSIYAYFPYLLSLNHSTGKFQKQFLEASDRNGLSRYYFQCWLSCLSGHGPRFWWRHLDLADGRTIDTLAVCGFLFLFTFSQQRFATLTTPETRMAPTGYLLKNRSRILAERIRSSWAQARTNRWHQSSFHYRMEIEAISIEKKWKVIW